MMGEGPAPHGGVPMGLFDALTSQGGSLVALAAKNPQLLSAALAMLNPKDVSVGGSGGLGSIVEAFGRNGLGDVVSSWIGTGANRPVDAGALSSVLGEDVLARFAQKAGLPADEASVALSQLLPMLVDHLTPQGRVPDERGLDSALG